LHAIPFAHPMVVSAGDYSDLADSQIVILTAGVNQKPGETRLQLLERNAAIFKEIVPKILGNAPKAILLVATNPVDVMTHLTARYAAEYGIRSTRVIGSGTTLDTARFRALLAQHLQVDAHHIHGYVLGEHGDSEVLTWSVTQVAGIPVAEFCRQRTIAFDESVMARIDEGVRHAAYTIIAGKGATYYGIGSAIARIVEVILRDQRAILSVCTPSTEIAGVANVTVSLPHLIGGEGVLATFPPSLGAGEQSAMHASATIVRTAIDSLELEMLK
jgi:L-lactate dehydrogenase